MYAVEKANNLLAAMLDNHLQHGNKLGIDPRRIIWRRVIDLNDRALREIFVGLGGVMHGVPRQDGFNITPASEIMAMLCLAHDYQDLGRRLAQTVIAFTYDGKPIRAADIKANGAMQVLLRDAVNPNLVQTLEGTPAFVHAGPFANIAQGTNSAIATRMALKCSDYVVTEAGFATDLGAEKFVDIKCRIADLKPQAVVIVATVKAIEWHGGGKKDGGLANLQKHIENIKHFGLKPVVAINRFTDDKPAQLRKIRVFCEKLGVEATVAEHWAKGGKGATDLAKSVLRGIKNNRRRKLKFAYPLSMPLDKKIETLAHNFYGADGVDFDPAAQRDMALLTEQGFGELPVCVAKTAASLSDNPLLRGRPRGFRIKVNELRVSAGAGFIVVIAGNIMTMPGLPKVPAAAKIKVLKSGRAVGLA
jgi:formate--tetrahydrofolate ligase